MSKKTKKKPVKKKRIEIRLTDVSEDLHERLTENGSKQKRGPGKEALLFLEKNY